MNLKGAKVVVTIPSDEAAEPEREPMPAWCKFAALWLFGACVWAALAGEPIVWIGGTAALMIAVMGS